jgi:CheY-like chemotaxis protein/curved DNA-binding protein CbpA
MGHVTEQPRVKPLVLVVEDNEDVRRVAKLYLESHDYRVVEAGDGLAGLAAFERERPDLILFDVLLPKLDGIEAIKRLRKSPGGQDVPVIMMSAVLQTRDLHAEATRLKVATLLQKPFQVRRLLEEVDRVLGRVKSAGVPGRGGHQSPASATAPAAAPDAAPPTAKPERLIAKPALLPEVGNLEEVSLPKVLHALFSSSRTGRLRVVSGTTEKRIYISSGLPVYAESSLPEETLGAHLVAKGKITVEQNALARREMDERGRHFGEALLKLGFIGPHDLFNEMESHLSEKIVSTFSWRRGRFKFEDDESWKDEVVIARLKPGRIVIDGIRRHWPLDAIFRAERFTWDSAPFSLDEAPYTDDHMSLNSGEMKILQLVRRDLSLREIAVQSGDRDAAVAFLYALFILERIGFSLGPRAAHSSPSSTLSQRPAPAAAEAPIANDAPSTEEKAQALLAEYIKYRTADYFTLLGVTQDATQEQIAAAFQTRQQRYHADTLIGIDAGLVHEKIEELYVRVHTAFRTLVDAGLREKYLAELDKGASGTMLTQQSKTGRFETLANKPRHEVLFEDGFSLLRNGEFARALPMFEEAEKIESKARYAAYRTWCSYLAKAKPSERVEQELSALAKQNGDDALMYYLLGNFYMRENNEKRAVACYEKTLEVDAQNIDAARQLRIIRMRQRQKSSESSGLFDLFKKK